jgi:hypothetical protein
MKHLVKVFFFAAVITLVGCGAPKPPGWPAGEERPINPSHLSKVAR